jgi:tetratricopeptide (TPR) repeat protein
VKQRLQRPRTPGQPYLAEYDDGAAWTVLEALVLTRELDDLGDLDEKALTELNEAVAKRPEEADGLLRRGHFHANRGHWEQAAADFTRVVELWPKESRSWMERGRFFVQQGQREKAVADFAKAAALHPEDMELRLNCARGRVAARDWKGAAADFRRVVAFRPDDVPLRVQCGEAEAAAGAWDRAVADLAFAVERKPEEIQNWHLLALAQLGAGDRAGYQTSCTAMKARFLQAPDMDTAGLLFFTCAVTPDADADMKSFAERATLFGIINSRGTGLSKGWFRETGGAVCYRAGQLQEAIDCFTGKLLGSRRNPGLKPSELLFLAMAHYRLGQMKEAQDYLAKAETWMAAADKHTGDGLGGVRASWSQWRERVIVRMLRKEAEALIKLEKP